MRVWGKDEVAVAAETPSGVSRRSPAYAYLQMNVLHLHLSDWAGVRFAVAAYPELTAGLNGQFYTAADAADLVAYAKERAVRIVPEVRLTD